MKKLLFVAFLFLSISASNVNAQEKYGRTLNLGAGVGYYGYIGGVTPAFNVNYEFDIVKNFTLAPFVSFYTFQNYHYYNEPNNPGRDYYYRETVVPVGMKGYYYFDDLLNLPAQFDLYAAASLGFNIRTRHWENGYYGDRYYGHDHSYLYGDAHAGGEYHFTKGLGFYVDLSTGLSTVGIALHMR